jgi:surfeit locus 1 family protein
MGIWNMRRFEPTAWATLTAAAGVAVTIALGFWQLGRADEKLKLVAEDDRRSREPPVKLGAEPVSAEQLDHAYVEARGRFDVRGMILLDNRVRQGLAGYEVVMPLDIAGGKRYVLVNRGWIAAGADRSKLPQIKTPDGELLIQGKATVPGKRIYELGSTANEGTVWQNLTIDRYRARFSYPIHAVVIEQRNDTGDMLVRAWPTHDRRINVHRSYAFQWFSLAAAILVLYVVLSLRRVTA